MVEIQSPKTETIESDPTDPINPAASYQTSSPSPKKGSVKTIIFIIAIIIIVILIGVFIYYANHNMTGNVIFDTNKTKAAPISTSNLTMPSQKILMQTSEGNITLELYPDKAPITVANFLSYIEAGTYENTVFHRVIRGFMIQGGGFTSDGNQKPTQAPIPLESNNGLKNNGGTIAMARTNNPNSATDQFFINTADNSFLDFAPGNPGYAVFGKVTAGMDIVKKIESVKTSSKYGMDDWPVQDVVIKKVSVI